MPGVAFHIKAMEPEGETLPAQVNYDEDSQAEDSDEHDSDDDSYHDDDDGDIAPYDTSLMRYGSVHIRDVARDVSPTTLSRYQTFGSCHIEDILPTPTQDLERFESTHIDDLESLQESARVELRTRTRSKSKSKSRSRSKSQKKSSKESSKTKSESRSKRSGSKPKKTKETKDGSKSSRKSKKKSKASKQQKSLYPSPLEVQQSITFSEMKEPPSSSSNELYPSRDSIMSDPWQSSSKLLEQIDHDQFALSDEQRQLLENIDNFKQIESITQGMTQSERDAFLREQNELFEKIAQNDKKLAAMDLQRSKLTNAPRSPPSKSCQRKQPKHSSAQPTPQVEECLHSLQIDQSILNTMDQEAFLREQKELFEKIADAERAQLTKAPPSPSKRSGRKPPPRTKPLVEHVTHKPFLEECFHTLQIDPSILDAMDPYERKVFVEEQQQLMEKIRREKAAKEADARFARELAAQQQALSAMYPSMYPASCAKQDDWTASTCTPSSLGTQESDHSFETLSPSWATTVVDPPVYYK